MTRSRGQGPRKGRFGMMVERLEARSLLATLFVDAGNITGIEDGSAGHPYKVIQGAINLSAAGDTIKVAAGTYAEALNVSHPLSLLGANAGVNPNTGTRLPETVIIPPDANPTAGDLVLVTANNVTIDGLTIDGHNALPGGTSLNGVSSNAASGITNIDPFGKLYRISGLTAANDVIRDLTAFGVIADYNDFKVNTTDVSTGNAIRNNRIDNIPLVSPTPGRGISIEDNFYADVTGNVITRAGTGIQSIFYLAPNPSGVTSTISNNEVHAYDLGIYLWTHDADSPSFAVANNKVSAETGPGTTATDTGIKLLRILHSDSVTLTNNDVTGEHFGIGLDYTTTSSTVTVAGGTLSGNDYGVLLTNDSPPSSELVLKPVQAKLAGVTVRDSHVAGLSIVDAASLATAPVTLNVDPATVVTGSPHGAILSGPDARLVEAVAPTLTLTGMPPSSTTLGSATFTFTASDNVSTPNDIVLRYSLDNQPLAVVTSPIGFPNLAVGSHSFQLMGTDQAGNVSSTTYTWTVKARVTATPSSPLLDAASDSGVSNQDGITNVNTPTFVGTAPAGSTVTLKAGTTVLGTTTADPAGNWRFVVKGPGSVTGPLGDGTYAVTATATDATGLTSPPSAPRTIVIDTVAPTIQATRTPPNASGWNGSAVIASYTAGDAGSGLASPASGSFTFSAAGAGQSHVFTVTDVAGNTASATVGNVNIDTTPPAVTVNATPSQGKPAGKDSVSVTVSGKISSPLSGVADAIYEVRDSTGRLVLSGSLTLGAGGTFSVAIALDSRLLGKSKQQTYTITVSAHNKAGIPGSASTTVGVGKAGGSGGGNDQDNDNNQGDNHQGENNQWDKSSNKNEND